jgi:hypothetical protein
MYSTGHVTLVDLGRCQTEVAEMVVSCVRSMSDLVSDSKMGQGADDSSQVCARLHCLTRMLLSSKYLQVGTEVAKS